MAKKIVLCRCEDVTLADLEHCVSRGYADIEEVKRYTGFGTGPCQGKECLGPMATQLARLTQAAPEQIRPFTSRPPLAPTPIKILARAPDAHRFDDDKDPEMIAGNEDEDDESRADASGEIRLPATLESSGPVPAKAEIVIVGGGVVGLAIAYYLARRGLHDVVVLERGYLAEGASGRNGGGVRQQWSTEINIRLMQESVELCRRFAVDLGVNVWFRQGGYLFLARTQKEVARLQKNIDLQNRCGVHTKMLDPKAAQEIVPEMDIAGIVGAAYNPTDGILFPWPFLWGYARQAAAHGVRIFTKTPVSGLVPQQGGGFEVVTPRGVVRARRVINATGSWSPALAKLIGVDVPTYPIRHEICSSEPLKPFLRPMVSELSSGLYCSQSMRGEIVGGVTVPGHGSTYAMGSTLEFLSTYARRLVRLMPILGDIKILRQWAGPYDQSPDGNPILGPAPSHPDFFLACGFVGHGFMMAPIVGKLYAEYLTGDAPHEIFSRYTLARFTDPALANQHDKEDFNIG